MGIINKSSFNARVSEKRDISHRDASWGPHSIFKFCFILLLWIPVVVPIPV